MTLSEWLIRALQGLPSQDSEHWPFGDQPLSEVCAYSIPRTPARLRLLRTVVLTAPPHSHPRPVGPRFCRLFCRSRRNNLYGLVFSPNTSFSSRNLIGIWIALLKSPRDGLKRWACFSTTWRIRSWYSFSRCADMSAVVVSSSSSWSLFSTYGWLYPRSISPKSTSIICESLMMRGPRCSSWSGSRYPSRRFSNLNIILPVISARNRKPNDPLARYHGIAACTGHADQEV